ncbi:MAG: hypothetical protein ACFFG0_04595 [Candidatus Thorarchaeota archaeon]
MTSSPVAVIDGLLPIVAFVTVISLAALPVAENVNNSSAFTSTIPLSFILDAHDAPV